MWPCYRGGRYILFKQMNIFGLWSWVLVEFLKLGLVNIFNFKFSRDADVWLRFWSWCLVDVPKIIFDQDLCLNLWYDLISTFGSVVPLAMFVITNTNQAQTLVHLVVPFSSFDLCSNVHQRKSLNLKIGWGLRKQKHQQKFTKYLTEKNLRGSLPAPPITFPDSASCSHQSPSILVSPFIAIWTWTKKRLTCVM